VPLADEVAAVRSYLEIEAIRFEDKLQVSVDVDPAILDARVPPFALLPLLENAIKHGFVRAPLRVHIRAYADVDAIRLEVANSGQWRRAASAGQAGPEGTGTGLRNLEERLAATLPGRARLAVAEQDGWVRAVITLARGEPRQKDDERARDPGR
jgi:LytS/YehU family sensor histidine kinase